MEGVLHPTWTEIGADLDRLAAENRTTLHPDTIGNARLFVRFASSRYIAAAEIGIGYRPTIRMIWSTQSHPVEVEIFQGHYEYYRFSDRATEIKHVACVTRDCVPDLLVSLLDPIISTSAAIAGRES
jgi:hypothetical protein